MNFRSVGTVVFGLFVTAFVAGLAYFQFVFAPAATRAYLKSRPTPIAVVNVAKAKTTTWQERLRFLGDIEAQRDIVIASEVDGRIDRVGFTNGSFVKKGVVLFALDASVEKAQREGLKAALQDTQLALDRQSTLAKHHVTTKAAFDDALAARDEAKAKVEQIDALIAQKTITAPFDGWVGITQFQTGAFIATGSVLVTLHKRDAVFVEFSIPEHQLAKLAVGTEVELSVSAHAERTFQGSIVTLGGRVDLLTRTMKVRANISNPDNLLLPGMSAIVEVLTDKPRSVVTVPRTTVVYGINGAAVLIAKPAPLAKKAPATLVVERRAITVGPSDKASVTVMSGVKSGELVVTSGQNKLVPGSLVRVDHSASLAQSSAPLSR